MLQNEFLLTFVFFLIVNYGSGHILQKDSLLMVHALFRHGERITESFYPTDPHANNTFYPIGKGGLTNRGKQQELKLGQYLRKRYGSFIGDTYTNDVMEVRSTGFIRTRMSALLVLAGLWPPKNEQIWNEQLQWLPIPVDYKPYEEDDLLNPGECELRKHVLKNQYELEKVKEKYVTPYADLLKYIEEKTKKPMRSPADLADLYLILTTEEGAANLVLPEWTKSVYPEPLYGAASLAYNYFNYNSTIRKINAGYFLKKILNDFQSKINEREEKENAKICLYSGHESTLGHVLDALKMKPHIAPYGSVVLFELHKTEEEKYIVKIIYRQGVDDGTELQEIVYPGCQTLCPIDKLRELLKVIIPDIPYKEACRLKYV